MGSDELQEEADDVNRFDEFSRRGTLQRKVHDALPENVRLDALMASNLTAAPDVRLDIAK